MEKKMPAYKQRIGRISIAVWRNAGKNGGEFFTANLSRSYRTKDGKPRDTSTLNGDDLPLAIRLAEGAFRFIEGEQASEQAAESDQASEEAAESGTE